MRIVFLCNSFYPHIGGAEFVCKDIVDTLSQQHDVTVITQPASDRANSEYNIIELKAVTSYSIMKELPNTFDIIQPDLFISFGYGKFFSDFTGKYAKDHGKPFIFMPCGDFHTNQDDVKKIIYGKFMGAKVFNFANTVITATHGEKFHWMIKHNVPQEKIKVIPYNLPKDFTKINIKEPIVKEDYYLYIGRTGPNKKIAEMIEGYIMSGTKKRLIIAGKGTDSNEIKNLCNERISVLGPVSEDIKKILIKDARAVVYPSNFESFGLVLLEADAFGTPFFMSNIQPFNELASGNPYIFENNPISISKVFKENDTKKLKSPKIILPNFEKELLSVVNSYENSNVL